MFFSDYKRAFDILSSVVDTASICLKLVTHSVDGKYIVFTTTNPDIRYYVEVKTGRVTVKNDIDKSVVEFLN